MGVNFCGCCISCIFEIKIFIQSNQVMKTSYTYFFSNQNFFGYQNFLSIVIMKFSNWDSFFLYSDKSMQACMQIATYISYLYLARAATKPGLC